MASLPPIPAKPDDRLETRAEYETRRAVIATHRQMTDQFLAWMKKNPQPGGGFPFWGKLENFFPATRSPLRRSSAKILGRRAGVAIFDDSDLVPVPITLMPDWRLYPRPEDDEAASVRLADRRRSHAARYPQFFAHQFEITLPESAPGDTGWVVEDRRLP
jgi:hypothetical protein